MNETVSKMENTSDTISRQAALDAIRAISDHGDSVRANALGLAEYAVENMPTVQPEITDEQFKDYCRKRCLSVVTNEFMYEVRKMVPSAQPKRGKWKGYNTDKEGWKRTDGSPVFMSCSECNGVVLNNGSAHWNFCPNCGADMRGEADVDGI